MPVPFGRYYRSKALLIAIPKVDGYETLEAPCSDLIRIRQHLQGRGYTRDDIVECSPYAPQEPNRDALLREMRRLVLGARPGDRLFLYVAAHGVQVKDVDGDEEDFFDEAIVCSDGYCIVDDEMFEIMVRPLPAGCYMEVVFDACSSGTGLDLPYHSEITKNDYSATNLPRILRRGKLGPAKIRKESKGTVVMWSACRDDEEAHEVKAGINGAWTGALTSGKTTCIKAAYVHF
ncbi:peptidase C14 [Sistotremastrum suecicum HHB10207 ss-3]|uniref:Peptidase C14 n=1 Tax=Sistotremastrum suecicum HHB10207 ss-3 TaxID=1314776 RepID=A0A165YZX3_9AGAM|nr:peptidase C14 [Sistotremastrum suecicum HHB10207 ss-3]